MDTKFLLLLGPSGVGKSTIIDELKRLDARFVYISPYTTRSLRPGETNKVSISDAEMDQLDRAGQLLVINQLYGIRYATPRGSIEQALTQGNFPVLDWPITRLDIMRRAFPGKLYTAYVAPPTLEVLRQRLASDGRDVDGNRLRSAEIEFAQYLAGRFDQQCDLKLVSVDGHIPSIAVTLLSSYLHSLP